MKLKQVSAILLFLGFVSAFTSVTAQNKTSDQKLFDNGYVVPESKLRIADQTLSNEGDITKKILYSIERGKHDTKVTFLQPIYFDSQWVRYSPETTIVDRATGDEYVVRGYSDEMPIDRLLIVKGCNRKYIFITLIFPKLKSRVKIIDIIPRDSDVIDTPSNNTGVTSCFYRVNIADYEVNSKKSKNQRVYR